MTMMNSTKKSRTQGFANIIRELRANRDTFIKEYAAAQKAHEQALSLIKRDFVMGSPRQAKETESENRRYQTALSKLRDNARLVVFTSLETLRDDEIGRLQEAPNRTAFEQLQIIGSMPLSVKEFRAVYDKYMDDKLFKDDYWVEKKLTSIAKQNGIEIDTGGSSNLDERLNILSEVAENYATFINQFEGQGKTRSEIMASVSDDVLDRAVLMYSEGAEIDTLMSDSKSVSLVMARVHNSSDIIETAAILRTAINNANDNPHRKAGLLARLACDKKISTEILELAGVAPEIQRYREKGLHKAFYDVEQLVTKLRETENKAQTIINTVKSSKDSERNELYLDTVRRAAQTDKSLKKAFEEAGQLLFNEETE